MKASSIISIFVSIVLIVSGIGLCMYARAQAPNDAAIDGNTLVNEDGNVVTEVLFTGQTFTTVNINVENCKVEIHGNAETSSVTLINFNENTYVASAGEKVLTVSNKVSLLDYINFSGSGVKFSGVWKTLRSFLSYDTSVGEREIHIYIGNDADVSKINVNCSEGSSLRCLDLAKECDISFTAYDSSLELSNINAASLSVAGSGSTISLGNASVTSFEYSASDTVFTASGIVSENLTVDSTASDISLLNCDSRSIVAELDSGKLVFSTKYDRASYFRKINITEGVLLENGLEIGQKDESPAELLETSAGTMTVTVGAGSIDITFGSEILPPLDSGATNPTNP